MKTLLAIFLEKNVELLFVNGGPVQLAATKKWYKKEAPEVFHSRSLMLAASLGLEPRTS